MKALQEYVRHKDDCESLRHPCCVCGHGAELHFNQDATALSACRVCWCATFGLHPVSCTCGLDSLLSLLIGSPRSAQEEELLSALKAVASDRHACGTMKRRAEAAIAKAEADPPVSTTATREHETS